jgi:hypothetical protein
MPVTITTQKPDRVPSTIQFPYTDMSDAIVVAEGLLKGGGVPLSRDQLAAAVGLAPGGGGFATKVATARTFGVLETVAGKYQLTELGYEIVEASRQAEAKVKAFMNVELFKRAYDEFKGKLLPPRPHGLDAAFISFGVTAKNARHARLAFEKSARLAGLYPSGNEDRLVMPFGAPAAMSVGQGQVTVDLGVGVPALKDGDVGENLGFGDRVDAQIIRAGGIHKSILGMLEELPPPKTKWNKSEQADWLDAMATLFQVIYKNEEVGLVEVKFTPVEIKF